MIFEPAHVIIVIEAADVEGPNRGVDEGDADFHFSGCLNGADGRQELAVRVARLGSSPARGNLTNFPLDD